MRGLDPRACVCVCVHPEQSKAGSSCRWTPEPCGLCGPCVAAGPLPHRRGSPPLLRSASPRSTTRPPSLRELTGRFVAWLEIRTLCRQEHCAVAESPALAGQTSRHATLKPVFRLRCKPPVDVQQEAGPQMACLVSWGPFDGKQSVRQSSGCTVLWEAMTRCHAVDAKQQFYAHGVRECLVAGPSKLSTLAGLAWSGTPPAAGTPRTPRPWAGFPPCYGRHRPPGLREQLRLRPDLYQGSLRLATSICHIFQCCDTFGKSAQLREEVRVPAATRTPSAATPP